MDIRKNLFYTLAERNWPLIGMEALGMSLEDIFITIVDQTSSKNRYERRDSKSRRRTSVESEIAKNMVAKSTANTSEMSDLFEDDKK